MDMKYNPIGFNKQTESLLCGVGGKNLIKEFKKRNISTDALHKLTKEDFIQLGNMFTSIIMYQFYTVHIVFMEIASHMIFL